MSPISRHDCESSTHNGEEHVPVVLVNKTFLKLLTLGGFVPSAMVTMRAGKAQAFVKSGDILLVA